jgi:hypothetical protein
MDISVSGLNGRLASKLPPELPLGLVFVVGKVEQLQTNGFVLVEGPHQLHCRTEESSDIGAGDEVRASGHLMFDSEQLQYYLLARDLEIVTSEPLGTLSNSRELLAESEGLLLALAEVKARAAAAPSQSEEALPVWVKKLAPPGVQVSDVEGEDEAVETARLNAPHAELDENLVSLLSEAMDSDEEMELTPELLAKYVPETVEPVADTAVPQEQSVPQSVEEPLATLSTSYRPANRQDTDWLVILLIISFFVLTIAAIVTIVLLLVQ